MPFAIPRFRPNIAFRELGRALYRSFFFPRQRREQSALFEQRLAETLDAPHAVTLSSVRFGLFHTLKYLNLASDAEVLCTPLTIYPVMETILLAGCKPVFIDIEASTFSPDLEDAANKLNERTRVFFLTHLWGVPAQMDPIVAFCQKHNLILIEDASQCWGGQVGQRAVGTFGLAGLFSFSTTKTINTFKGAALVSPDQQLVDHLRDKQRQLPPLGRAKLSATVVSEMMLALFSHPLIFTILTGPMIRLLLRFGKRDYLDNRSMPSSLRHGEFPAFHQTAFTDIQAQTGLFMLDKVAREDQRRREIAQRYKQAFADSGSLQPPTVPANGVGNFWMYSIKVPERKKLRQFLWRRDKIDSAIPSIDACHLMDYFPELKTKLPKATALINNSLYLPCYHSMSDREVDRVIAAVSASVKAGCDNKDRDNP